MATLYQTAAQTRRIIVFVLLGVIAILVVDNVSRWLNSPSNPFAARVSFYLDPDSNLGDIPVPDMTSFSISEDSNPAFTIEGAFSEFPDSAFVYTIERPREKLTTVEEAVATAALLGFSGSYTSISTDEISWQNAQATRTLTFNKVTQQWRLRTKYLFDPSALATKQLNSNIQFYSALGTGIASRLGFTDRSLLQGTGNATYALLGPDGLFTRPFDQQSANYVSIDIFRKLPLAQVKNIVDLPGTVSQSDLPPNFDGNVYTIDPIYGSLYGSFHMIVSNQGATLNTDIYELDFINYTYNYTNFGVRSIITPEEAWDKARRGEGALTQLRLETADYFAQNQSLKVNKFAVNAVSTEVGYWEPNPWDGFVYPIYIFRGRAETDKGNASFTFFVDAIRRF
jgi:hypothetical protein